MGLELYRKKRDFRNTPEPSGEETSTGSALRFVVQKHGARRLHYDFRLELDGVLKSWAVPKGPSLDPGQKRLAVHVEDHPVDYGEFEGVIPPKQYGSGAVLLWDRGSWFPEGDATAAYQSGKLKFELKGEKLHGKWTLVRMHGAQAGENRENWLLIKERDAEARSGTEAEIVARQQYSVASGRNLEQIAADRDRVWQSKTKAAQDFDLSKINGARQSALPDSLNPQLAVLAAGPPQGEQWLHEIKFDGYRILTRLEQGTVKLYTRKGNDWTERLPAIAKTAAALPAHNAWLDGEVAVLRADGTTNFQDLQNALSLRGSDDIVYFVFDILHLDGFDLTDVPLVERKRILNTLLQRLPQRCPMIRYSDHVAGLGESFYTQVCRHSLEGIVSKRRDAPYRNERNRDWIKSKCLQRQEFVIGGFSEPAGSRTGFGALLLGVHDDDGRLRYSGRVGTGFNERSLSELHALLAAIKRKSPPFNNPPKGADARRVHWVEPELVADIDFGGWTEEQLIRHASFRGLREDKPAREVVRERQEPVPETASSAANAATGVQKPKENKTSRPTRADHCEIAGVRLTNPDRILYPDLGLTKRDLALYYESIAQWILPHLIDRPLSLVRCPQGAKGECFFQKHSNEAVHDAIARISIEESGGRSTHYMAANSVCALVSLVQIGVLELHTWGSRSDRPQRPDRMTLDLDPDIGLPWQNIVEAALLMRARLSDLGLTSFVKTTGGKGLHIVAPLVRKHSWDEVKAFSKALAENLAHALPDRFTSKVAKAKRGGKIFIDYLRNSQGATSVAAYSTRATSGAPVSTPIAWEELDREPHLLRFTVHNLGERLGNLAADPWRVYSSIRQSLTKPMKKELGIKE